MKKEEVYTKLFSFSAPTFYNWQRENRPIILLLEKYFSKEELEEFLLKGEITRITKCESLQKMETALKNRCKDFLQKNYLEFGYEHEATPAFLLQGFLQDKSKEIDNLLRSPRGTENFKSDFLKLLFFDDFIQNKEHVYYLYTQLDKMSNIELRYLVQYFDFKQTPQYGNKKLQK